MSKRTRNQIVPSLSDEQVADFRTPRSIASVKASMPSIQAWYDSVDQWKKDCHEAHANGNDIPAAPAAPDISEGRLTVAEYAEWLRVYNDGEKVSEVYAAYQPVDVQVARDAGMICIVSGSKKKHTKKPKQWDDKTMGEWNPGDFLIGPSHRGFKAGENVRMNHCRDITRLIDDAENNIFRIGGFDFAVGTSESSILHLVCASRNGSYEAIEIQRALLSLSGMSNLKNVVGRINNKPKTLKLIDGCQVCYLAGQVIEWGYLMEGDKEVTPTQLRKMFEGDNKLGKLKFVALPEHDSAFVGNLISRTELVKAWKAQLGKDGLEKLKARSETEVGDKLWTNSMVQMRVHPDSLNCLKVSSVQLGVIPYFVSDAEGNESQGVAVARRTNIDLNVTTRDAKRAAKESEAAEKPKAEKPKKESNSKTEKPKKSKAKKSKAKKSKTKKDSKTKTSKKSKTKKSTAKKSDEVLADAQPVAASTDDGVELEATEEVVVESAETVTSE